LVEVKEREDWVTDDELVVERLKPRRRGPEER
jgi:hypothetical protein